MIIFPAIDLKNGQCVRLVRGDMHQATVFSSDPSKQASVFEAQGFQWLHIVDLNGAFEGKSINTESIQHILKRVKLKIQLGGGIRDLKAIEQWLSLGVERVILGTVALRNPELVKQACRLFPGRIAVGIDGKEGFVSVEGWVETSTIKVHELALLFEDAGVAAIIYTDILRDGIMEGPNIEATRLLARQLTTPIIASGGVSSLQDIERLLHLQNEGVVGMIIGRAFYEGAIAPEEALARISSAARVGHA